MNGTYPATRPDIIIVNLYFRTMDILSHILKCHPRLNSKYYLIASIAKTQASSAIDSVDKDTTGEVSERSKAHKTTRAIQDIEDELSQFEERLASIDSQMEEWMQGRLHEGKSQSRGKQNSATDSQTAEDETEGQSYHKWSRYPGMWTPRPIGVL